MQFFMVTTLNPFFTGATAPNMGAPPNAEPTDPALPRLPREEEEERESGEARERRVRRRVMAKRSMMRCRGCRCWSGGGGELGEIRGFRRVQGCVWSGMRTNVSVLIH